MKIQICETTIATKNVETLKDFYCSLLGDDADVQHLEFFYKIKDKNSGSILCIVPHNGESKWDAPWVTFLTDDLKGAIAQLKVSRASDIENFGAEAENGDPITGVCFKDPDDRLMMLLYDDEL